MQKQFGKLKREDLGLYSSWKVTTLTTGLVCSALVPQRSNILSHIWTSEDVWPAGVCRDFILEWAAELQTRVQVARFQPEKRR